MFEKIAEATSRSRFLVATSPVATVVPGRDTPKFPGADTLKFPGADTPRVPEGDTLKGPRTDASTVMGADTAKVQRADTPTVPSAVPPVPGADTPTVPGTDTLRVLSEVTPVPVPGTDTPIAGPDAPRDLEGDTARVLSAVTPKVLWTDTPMAAASDGPLWPGNDNNSSSGGGGGSGHPPSYGQVLDGMDRLSHLLGRFLQASGRQAEGTGGPAARRSLRLERRDSGASAAMRAGGRRKLGPGQRGGVGLERVGVGERVDKGVGEGERLGEGERVGERETVGEGVGEEVGERVGEGVGDEVGEGAGERERECEGLAEREWALAAAGGEVGRMAVLLERDPGLLNRRDPVSGLTAVHWLAKRGDADGLLELWRLAGSAGLRLDVDGRAGGAGYTPLHLAAMQGHHMVIKLLVGAYNANVDARDYAGRKAWHYLGSGTPGKLRELVGAQEEEGPPRTGARPQRAGNETEQAQKKPPSFAIASVQRFFQLNYWRQWRSQRSVDRDPAAAANSRTLAFP